MKIRNKPLVKPMLFLCLLETIHSYLLRRIFQQIILICPCNISSFVSLLHSLVDIKSFAFAMKATSPDGSSDRKSSTEHIIQCSWRSGTETVLVLLRLL
jgi:hypothetical protein